MVRANCQPQRWPWLPLLRPRKAKNKRIMQQLTPWTSPGGYFTLRIWFLQDLRNIRTFLYQLYNTESLHFSFFQKILDQLHHLFLLLRTLPFGRIMLIVINLSHVPMPETASQLWMQQKKSGHLKTAFHPLAYWKDYSEKSRKVLLHQPSGLWPLPQ